MAKRTRTLETITHEEASRKNIPTAEYQSVMDKSDQSPLQVAYQRRNRDLDPQLVWRGKDERDRHIRFRSSFVYVSLITSIASRTRKMATATESPSTA